MALLRAAERADIGEMAGEVGTAKPTQVLATAEVLSCQKKREQPPSGNATEQREYYTTIGLLVCYGPPRALLLVAAQAIGFRSSGRGDPLHSRPGPSGVGVAGSAGAGPRCR